MLTRKEFLLGIIGGVLFARAVEAKPDIKIVGVAQRRGIVGRQIEQTFKPDGDLAEAIKRLEEKIGNMNRSAEIGRKMRRLSGKR